jgi:hypothetical protein
MLLREWLRECNGGGGFLGGGVGGVFVLACAGGSASGWYAAGPGPWNTVLGMAMQGCGNAVCGGALGEGCVFGAVSGGALGEGCVLGTMSILGITMSSSGGGIGKK